MKKNNVKTSQRGLKRDSKNKARLVRAKKKRDWQHMVAQVKFMQDYMKKAQEANAKASQDKEA
jgi:hypothetical protein